MQTGHSPTHFPATGYLAAEKKLLPSDSAEYQLPHVYVDTIITVDTIILVREEHSIVVLWCQYPKNHIIYSIFTTKPLTNMKQ